MKLSAAKVLFSSGVMRSRNILGRLTRVSRAKDLFIRGVREYSTEFNEVEELRLAKLYQRYLRMYMRENIMNVMKNAPFTEAMKGRNTPLYDVSTMTQNFVYIRKMSRGYRVGFDLTKKFNRRMTVRGLLDVLENGADLSQNDPVIKSKMRKYMFGALRSRGIQISKMSNAQLGKMLRRRSKFEKSQKNAPKYVKQDNEYRIPPRPFFDRITDSFITLNRGEMRDFVKGLYCLNIKVRKRKRRKS